MGAKTRQNGSAHKLIAVVVVLVITLAAVTLAPKLNINWFNQTTNDDGNTRGSGDVTPEFNLFTIRNEGNIYRSINGTEWTLSGNPGAKYWYTSMTSGSGTTTGYTYILRSDGKVYFTDRGTNEWYQYGYGAPSPPSSAAYVDITAGSETTSGYIYMLRNDGKVYFTDRGVNGWYQYGYGAPTLPSSTAYTSIACGSGATSGYIYVLRNDGKVYFTDRGVNGWNQYGYGVPTPPESTAYVAITTGSGTTTGYIYILRNDGVVYYTDRGTNGWYQYGYGAPSPPSSTAYTSIACGFSATSGYIYVLRNDGVVYFTDRGTNGWHQYGYGAPTPPTNNAYSGLSSGCDNTIGYIYILRNDGVIYFTDRGVNGWYQYGYGAIQPPIGSAYVSVATNFSYMVFALCSDGAAYKSTNGGESWSFFGDFGSDTSWIAIATSENYTYAMKKDGTIKRSTISGWSLDPGSGDAGVGISWVGLTVDEGNRLYALRNDGKTSTVDEDSWSSTWGDKGTMGGDTSWISITAFGSTGGDYVYAMRNNREVWRSQAGTSTTWSFFTSAGSDTSWVSMVLVNETTLHSLRNDGRIDKYAGSWSTVHSLSLDLPDTSYVCLARGIVLPLSPPTNIDAGLEGIGLVDVNITWSLSKDDENVANYVIYYNTSYDKSGTGYSILDGIQAGMNYYMHSGAGDGNIKNYFYYIQANGTSGNTAENDTQVGKFVLEMPYSTDKPRRLISIPLIQSDTTLTTVLQTIEGNYSYVQWYDPLDIIDHWMSYSTSKPSGFNDLLNIDHTMGLWVTMTASDNLTIAGRVPESTSIQLYEGWNFVSYASFINRTVGDALSGVPYEKVEGYDGTNAPYYLKILASTDWMEAGNGYWIRVTSDCTWTIFN